MTASHTEKVEEANFQSQQLSRRRMLASVRDVPAKADGQMPDGILELPRNVASSRGSLIY
jgi:hypothetical protein